MKDLSMQLTNVRYMTYRVGPTKLKKGKSMVVNTSMITGRLQSLINRGYFRLDVVEAPVILAKNSEPDEELPDTSPAPEVPAPKNIKVEKEVPVIVEKVDDKPKIIKRRRKKVPT
jgi:hypothetical protein